ncbi:hypothetical protein MTTB_01250 [Methanothermobacter tenebrarum]|jgi:hypothetical protein|uniref:Uncharacterized protein n=1 Tax=Methanothermobacter tenebrarum TaxID=680118 RepID=A0ABM7YBM8_9EURY|nr:hypothetical protein MTTB_01250 [Methanothermobacter tenebrarum]
MRSYSRDTKYIYEKIKKIELERLILFFVLILLR